MVAREEAMKDIYSNIRDKLLSTLNSNPNETGGTAALCHTTANLFYEAAEQQSRYMDKQSAKQLGDRFR